MKGSKSKPQDKSNQANTYETWEEARRVASRIGDIPSPFTTCIRFLRRDLQTNPESLSQESSYWINQLLRSPTFKAPLYFGALSFFPHKLELEADLSPRTLLRLYTLSGLIHAMCIIYLSKRAQTACDETEWNKLVKHLLIESEMAALVGHALPRIGFPLALLVGSLRQLGRAMFLLVDKTGFIAHVRATRTKGSFDVQDEIQRWNCNHVQVASILLQILGIGVETGTGLVNGLSANISEIEKLDEDSRRVLVCDTWVHALIKTGKEPEIRHLGEFYPTKAALADLLAGAEKIKKSGSVNRWLLRGRSDTLPDQAAPQGQANAANEESASFDELADEEE